MPHIHATANPYKSTRLTLHDAGGYTIKLRRVGDLVICSIIVSQNAEQLPALSIPLGYQRADPIDLQRFMYRGGVNEAKHWGAVRFTGQTIAYNGALNTVNAAHVEVWDTDDPHPII